MAKSLASWNTRINVVSRKDITNLIQRHYLPSLALLNLFKSKGDNISSRLSELNVDDLKAELKKMNLPVSGRKADLIARIEDGIKASSCQTLEGACIMDVGTGGGFPGLPLAVACPKASFTLVDSRSKKLTVVRALVEELGIQNVQVFMHS